MWNAVIAGVVFQHPSAAALLRELRRNGELRQLCGFNGTRKDGTTWEKVTKWFGYKLHLLVDSVYEMPLAFSVDLASSSDMTNLKPLIEDLEEHHKMIHI